jgi:hypothetical protein
MQAAEAPAVAAAPAALSAAVLVACGLRLQEAVVPGEADDQRRRRRSSSACRPPHSLSF